MAEKKDGFDIGFDDQIPEDVRAELRRFVQWVEDNYEMPVTLWVDFEYKHYLVSRKRKRVGYLFYWDDDPTEMPILRLPVRTERWSIEDILLSFSDALDNYFAWTRGEMHEDRETDHQKADAMLDAYLEYVAQNED